MDKKKILELAKVDAEVKRRNIEPLKNYNSGEVVHKKQLEFHRCKKRNRWIFGGNRTGKTECGAVETVWLILGIHPYRPNRERSECWVVSLSNRVQKEVAQAKILKFLPKSKIVSVVMSEGRKDEPESGIIECISVKNAFGNISKIWFKSCEMGREKFQGTSLDFVWFDEEPPEDIYTECKMRILDKRGEIFGTMTPLKGFTFVYEEIYLNKSQDDEIFCLFMSWEDNPFLDKLEVERFETILSPDEIKNRKYGRFSFYNNGLIYPEFDANINVIEPFAVPPEWQDIISIDPGLTNPLSCHFYARDFDDNVYVIAEHFESNKTVEYHTKKIFEIADMIGWKRRSNGTLEALIDSAANQRTLSSNKSVAELFYDNKIITNTHVNKDVLSGISKVKTYLKNVSGKSKLFIFSCCVNLIEEFKTYRWANGDSPLKKDDHALDELRYYIMSISPKAKPKPKSEIQLDKQRMIAKLKKL